jgi:hypothetical protein
MKNKKYQTDNPEWVTFYPRKSTGFYVEKAGYFDERPEIHTSVTQLIMLALLPVFIYYCTWSLLLTPLLLFGWGALYIHLPIRTGIQDCDSAAWGIHYHSNKLWIYIGGAGNFQGGRKWKTITMPWDLTWVRTSTLKQDHFWYNESQKNRLNWGGKEDSEGSYYWLEKNKWKETHSYTDSYDGTVVNATISVKEREWRPLWFQWTSLFAKKKKTIEVEFDKEVGKRKGSWKGGTLGCSYELLPTETPLECLRRMEKERDF